MIEDRTYVEFTLVGTFVGVTAGRPYKGYSGDFYARDTEG